MSPDVAVQLRSYLEGIEASAPPITVEELKQASSRQVPANTSHKYEYEYADLKTLDLRQADEILRPGEVRAPTGRPRWTVVVATVAAAAIVLVVNFVAVDRDAAKIVTEPAISPAVTEPTSPPTVTKPAVPTLTDSVGNEWSQVPHDQEVFTARMQSVTVGGPGLVAVGSDEDEDGLSAAVVWTSVDGITWSRVSHDEEVFGSAGMESVTFGGPGLVAVGGSFFERADGGDGSAAVVWTSVDGITWSRVSHDEEVFGSAGMESVTFGGPGLVAVGVSSFERANGEDGSTAVVWTSFDGITWARVPDNEEVFGGSRNLGMHSVTVGGPGLVAVGSADPHNGEDAAVWTSVDGIIWTRVADDAEVFGGTGEHNMTDVTAGGPGLVAVGWEFLNFNANAAVWTSVDAITWTRVPNDDDIFGGRSHQAIWGVTTDGLTVVAVGEDRSRNRGDGEVAVWTSEDGINWTRGLPDEDVIGSGFPLSVTVGGPGLVAVGDEMAWVATPKN